MEIDWAGRPEDIQSEKRAIKLSLVLSTLFFMAGITVALFSRSLALGIDAAYLFLDLCIVTVTIVWLEKLFLPATNRYNFGYFKLEPMIVLIQCLFLLGICTAGIITATQRLLYVLDGGELGVTNYWATVLFTICSTVICAVMWWYTALGMRRKSSTILQANLLAYKIDLYISGGLFLSFLFAYLLKSFGLDFYAELADPIISIGLCLILVHEPITLFWESVCDLLDVNPNIELQAEVAGRINRFLIEECKQPGNVKIKLRKAGRKYFVIAHYRIDKNLRFEEVDQIRKKLCRYFSENLPTIHLTCHPELA
jgi:cation diffusion facilitator family transporter